MPLDPLKVSNVIKESYIRYLTTAFRLRDQKLNALFREEAEKFWFINGPFLEATPPFIKGCFVKDLIEEGILNEDCECFLNNALPYLQKNPFYLHQEKALRKVINGRNIIISSGTGSGKTECFLIPIYNQLIKEFKDRKTSPGVRALLLYPMNALANDQLRRLREAARVNEKEMPDVGITFGRYVGDTPEGKKDGEEKFRLTNPGIEPVKSELLSREEMRENPPHILITNYAMLEYLLLRPKDSSFFDGEYANHWKFLVLDEVHIYNGANGIEMGMLIRRLKDRVCAGRKNVLQCIATSATLVKEKDDFSKVAEFATSLFDEKFEWNPDDERRQDIIKGDKLEIEYSDNTYQFPLQLYSSLNEIISNSPDQSCNFEKCYKICIEQGIYQDILNEAKEKSNGDCKKFLYEVLHKDQRITELKRILENGATKLEECIKQVIVIEHPTEKDIQAIISLVNLAVWARPEKDSLPLLPARYHLFVRAPEGIFVSFLPEPKIFLNRSGITGNGYPVFDLASCRRCGQEYLVGDIEGGKLVLPYSEIDTTRRNKYFLLQKEQTQIEEDEDEEVVIPEEVAEIGKIWKLCVKCGAIGEDTPSCSCDHENKAIRTLIEIAPKEGILNKCYLCGLRSINIVREFIFQQDAPAAVLATALFQNLNNNEYKNNKILVFSDSRQDAAFFAPYLEITYKRILYRRLITEVLKQNSSIRDYRLQSLCDDVLKITEERGMFDSGIDEKEKKKEVWGWLLQEFFALDRRICLEGVGLLSFIMIPPKDWKPIVDLSGPPWNLTDDESIALYQLLINTLRFNNAIDFPKESPGPKDEIFARFHRDRVYKFRGERSDAKNGIYSFIPYAGRLNTRLEFLRKLHNKILKYEAVDNECRKLLGKIWDDLRNNWVDNGFHQFSDPIHGVLFQLDYKYWKIVQEQQGFSWFVCDRCGMISSQSIQGVCPTFGCNGNLESLSSASNRENIKNNHYYHLYTHLTPVNMIAREHTAQLRQNDAADVQQKFINGKINILSCSTTFELGVDLGELETIFLRNVPPEPSNYVQRSGRAGRRLDSIGFTLTFAQLRSHDLTYFKEPEKMIEGRIIPPVIEIKNEKIIRRHLHSIVLARFFREYPDYFGNVNSFFRLGEKEPSATEKIKKYLETKPDIILESLKSTLPVNLHGTFNLDNWGWVKDFIEKDGYLEIADASIKDEYAGLEEFYTAKEYEWNNTKDQRKRNSLNYDMNWANNRKDTIRNRNLIDFLATHTVIPKYGFPVDVVELTPYSHIREAKQIQLERDLRIAISEFAPGNQVVAKGYLWESAGLKIVRDRTWPLFWYATCPECNRFHIQIGTIKDNPPSIECKGCKRTIERKAVNKFITPVFGFVTSKEKEPQKPGESRPKREFSTRPYFFDFKEPEEKTFHIGKFDIKCQYSSHGELAVICKGKKGNGFWVCFTCGAAFSERPHGSHRKPFGDECSSSTIGHLHFGHTFKTDVLTVSFEKFERTEVLYEDGFWFSLLYATLEGASQALGIRRQDLDGCLLPHEGKTELALFDNVPGGASHVKRLMDEQNLCDVFKTALTRVKNCTCGEETSCYGCLRNYQNQFCHNKLKRGIVQEFLERNILNS